MRFLLDTNVVSEVGRHQPDRRVLNWLQAHETQAAVPSIVLAEQYRGAQAAELRRGAKLKAELDALVAEAPERIIAFDALAARAWAEYVERPALKARPRSYPDTQIAAIALAHDLIVVTRNTDDFPEVQTLNPFGA